MKEMSKQETKYNKVVHIEDGEIQVLDYTFIHSDSFKGATGSRFNAISKAEYKERTSRGYVVEHLLSAGFDNVKNQAQAVRMYQDLKNSGELDEFMFDHSYYELWDYLRTFGYPESEYPIFECAGGGRMFNKDFQGNVNPELSAIIREFESK
jgi:hypothetical protein